MWGRKRQSSRYQTFQIHVLEKVTSVYPVVAQGSGDTTFHGAIPGDLPEELDANQWLDRSTDDETYLRHLGSHLFQALFAGDVLIGFRARQAAAEKQGMGLRIVLTLDPPELARLPWELICVEGFEGFLARSSSTPVVRHLSSRNEVRPRIQEKAFRVLVAVAQPEGLPPLGESREEAAAIVRELSVAKGRVRVDILEGITRSKLKNAFREAEGAGRGYHLLHFIGHGASDEKGGRLVFEDVDGRSDPVPAEQVAELLGETSVRMVFLNACASAQAGEPARPFYPFQGVAQACINLGIRAALAMQVKVVDAAASNFAREFYASLADGEEVEKALLDARQTVGKVEAADWAVPVLYSRVMQGLILPVFPRKTLKERLKEWASDPIRVAMTVGSGLFGVLSVVGLLLGLFGDVQSAREPGGVLNFIWPAPTATLVPTPTPTPLPPMPSTGFNVAVAEFAELDAAGNLVSSEVGRELSEWLVYAIEKETEDVDPMVRKTIWGPEKVKYIPGKDADARAANAAQFATAYSVTVLIYGVVTVDDVGYQVSPEFYVSRQYFGYGSEVSGPDRLGHSVPFTPPLTPGERRDINRELNARTTALEHLVKGLTHFYAGSYDLAWAEFKSAESVKDWQPEEGKEVIYLLMGAAKLELYQKAKGEERDPWQLAQATDAFAQAYDLDHDYARSYLGLGGVALLQATPNLNECDIDGEKLAEASAWYSASLNASDRPASAYVPVKAAYGLAQAHLFGYECRIPGWSGEQSRDYLKQVIAAYEDERRPPDLIWFAGHAHALLGRLANLEANWLEMRSECEEAIKLLEDVPGKPPTDSIAQYWAWLALAEKKLGELDAARENYRRAIQIGAETVERKYLDAWQAELDRLEKGAP